MSANEIARSAQGMVGLKASQDARAIVRLFQCSQCSYPLREPITLPCGSSLCRSCLPPLYKRENITYSGPLREGRSEGFLCPYKECNIEHSLGDCSRDVTMNKIMEIVKTYMARHKSLQSDTPVQVDERLDMGQFVDSAMDVMPRSRVLNGGRLVATFNFAEMGELNYFSDVSYTSIIAGTDDKVDALDTATLEDLREVVRAELECQVCYAVMVDPLTTSCGHTFCRRCVARVLDHANLCPICRRRLPLAPGLQLESKNKRITYILEGLLTELLEARMLAMAQEDAVDEEVNMPLFPCTLAFPEMPTFLHIFEPRYRLMIRRCVENGSRKFGMLMYNNHRAPQGHLGPVQYMQYGTVLHIDRVEMLPDGRSLIETRGVYRFSVLEGGVLDGYCTGRIQRVDDIPIAEEEAIEARETGGPHGPTEDPTAHLDRLSTQQLLDYALEFIAGARARSARWLHQRVLDAYGQPPSDPATFPYWFASVLPIAEEEKYQLLPATSVRERLKITARWIQRLEAARW
jgi:Lon protease-like protein